MASTVLLDTHAEEVICQMAMQWLSKLIALRPEVKEGDRQWVWLMCSSADWLSNMQVLAAHLIRRRSCSPYSGLRQSAKCCTSYATGSQSSMQPPIRAKASVIPRYMTPS